MKYSLKIILLLDSTVTKKDLLEWNSSREDVFGEVKQGPLYGNTGGYAGEAHLADTTMETRFMDNRTFHTIDESAGNLAQVKSHLRDIPDHLAWSRGHVGPVGDVPNSRVVQEIQSDLHQQGRQRVMKEIRKTMYIIVLHGDTKRYSTSEDRTYRDLQKKHPKSELN